VRFTTNAPQEVAPGAENLTTGAAIDPVAGQGACARVSASNEPGTASYILPKVKDPYTLLGAPTVIADLSVGGPGSELAARLWDVAPDGSSQTLVARGLYRIAQSGRAVFQLHANGWRFETGHRPKLQLLSQDAPYARPSNLQQPVRIGALDFRLPTHEAPGTAAGVKTPKPPVMP
jgi:predicted acyl esterase